MKKIILNKIKCRPILYFFAVFITLLGCEKGGWLDIKPNRSYDLPGSLSSAVGLLDNSEIMNNGITNQYIEVSSDDFEFLPSYLSTAHWLYKNSYLWFPDFYGGQIVGSDGWFRLYRVVHYANQAIEILEELYGTLSDREDAERIDALGRAYFFRGLAFYHLALTYGDVFNPAFQTNGLGIAIRLSNDPNIISERASVEETYSQIISDLSEAAKLLRTSSEINRRPARPAAWAMLAKTYLQIQDYESAKRFADSCLKLNDAIIDYNVVENVAYPFDSTNPEIIFFTSMGTVPYLTLDYTAKVNPQLYTLYSDFDLRRSLFFQPTSEGNVQFKGGYNNNGFDLFSGLSVPEILLIRAECSARTGDLSHAIDDLKLLLVKRYLKDSTPKLIEEKDEILNFILDERRRELVGRGLRWYDLRRLNLEAEFQTELCRVHDGISVCLPPNDPRYLFQIPLSATERSKVLQNKRE